MVKHKHRLNLRMSLFSVSLNLRNFTVKKQLYLLGNRKKYLMYILENVTIVLETSVD